jgi:hypothetical protein
MEFIRNCVYCLFPDFIFQTKGHLMRFLSLSVCLLLFSVMLNAQNANTSIPCAERANKLLNEAIGLMEKHYYRKDSVQWDTLVLAARDRIKQSGNCDDAYDAVKWCFSQMHERHSFIMTPVRAAEYNGNINSGATPRRTTGGIRDELLEKGIAYIDVPWISTADETTCTAFADSLQQVIAKYDEQGVTKWVVDLRRNTGGNCWPMLAGLGPLLGNGVLGYFVSNDERIAYSYTDGTMYQGKHSRCTVTQAHNLSNAPRKIVVLTGMNTASAGEIVALAFKGKTDVYLYGEPTAGLTTANATYSLSDGSLLVLTVCKEADRNGKICEGRILPDKTIPSNTYGGTDDIKTAAIMFLELE